MRSQSQSQAVMESAQACFPGGVNSPVRAFGSVGGTPVVFAEGKGKTLTDVDGNQYVDFCASWGPLIVGYSHDKVVSAVQEQAGKALTFGAPCAEEVTLAKKVQEWIPGLEMLRFVSSGTEATMSALRVAKAYTNRSKIIKFEGCYHGHSDALLVSAGSGLATFGTPSSSGVSKGAVEDTLVAPYNDRQAVEELFATYGSDIAAVIIEPMAANMGLVLPKDNFLGFLRDRTKEAGSLLIFDEVMTGFRIAKGGAQEAFGVQPDMWTFGKIIGGGLPAAAYGASRDIMGVVSPLGSAYQAGTLSGNPLAMVAGLTTLQVMEEANAFEKLEVLGKTLDGLVKSKLSGFSGRLTYVRKASFFCFFFGVDKAPSNFQEVSRCDMALFNKVYARWLEEGIYLGPSGYEVGFLSLEHTASDLEKLVEVVADVLKEA